MSKAQYYRQISIDDEINTLDYEEDEHLNQFDRFLFDELLYSIRRVPFDHLIQDQLQRKKVNYNNLEAHALDWFYTADWRLVGSKPTYSFRFPNPCDPEFYRSFEIKNHRLFRQVTYERHHSYGWYQYIGKNRLNEIGRFLKIRRVVQNPHRTELFVNQEEERIDIQFKLDSINERIAITYERGPPDLH